VDRFVTSNATAQIVTICPRKSQNRPLRCDRGWGMRKSFRDSVRSVTKEKLGKSPEWRHLRGRVTLSCAVALSGLDEHSFASKYLYGGRSESGLMGKWLSTKTALWRSSAQRLNKELPGTIDTFDLSLFELLTDEPIEVKRIRKLLEPYRATEHDGAPLVYWKFPNQADRLADRSHVPVLVETDTQGLFACNDHYSFIAILGVVRLADETGDSDLHWNASKDMFRALPALLKLPWFRENAESLIRQLERVRCRMLVSSLMFDVDWDVIWRQVDDPNHQPNRNRRPLNPATARFVEIEDPIMEAEIIPGAEVRRRERVREARMAKK